MEHLDEVISGLQTLRKQIAQHKDIADRIDKAKAVAAATDAELKRVQSELKVAAAGLTKEQAANEKRHADAIAKQQAELRFLEQEIGKANSQLEDIEKKVAQAGGQYSSYVRGIAALKKQLEVA